MANKVKFGLSNVHYSVITYSGGTEVYSTPVALKGSVSLNLDSSGEQTDFFADNISFFSTYANQGYSGTLEVAMLDDTFLTDVLGQTIDDNGAILEKADDSIKEFALGFQIEGDDKNRRVWFYRCTCARPSMNAETKTETIDPNTDELDLTIMPRISDQAVKIALTDDGGAEYSGWFSDVYEAQ